MPFLYVSWRKRVVVAPQSSTSPPKRFFGDPTGAPNGTPGLILAGFRDPRSASAGKELLLTGSGAVSGTLFGRLWAICGPKLLKQIPEKRVFFCVGYAPKRTKTKLQKSIEDGSNIARTTMQRAVPRKTKPFRLCLNIVDFPVPTATAVGPTFANLTTHVAPVMARIHATTCPLRSQVAAAAIPVVARGNAKLMPAIASDTLTSDTHQT